MITYRDTVANMATSNADAPAASLALGRFFDCHDLLVKVASHLLPARRFNNAELIHPMRDQPYTPIERFVRISRTCREAGNEILYSEIHLSTCNIDAPILLYRTLKENPHLAVLVKYFDTASVITYDIRGVPAFGRRAILMLIDLMPRLTGLRINDPAIVEVIEPRLPRLDNLYLDLSPDRDRDQMAVDAAGNPILLVTEAEMQVMTRTRHVVIGGAVSAMVMHTALAKMDFGQVGMRSLHLRSLILHPDFVRDVLGGIWAGAITTLIITDEHSSRWNAGPGVEPLWKDVINALQGGLRYLRISEPRLEFWQMDLSHLQLVRLDLTLASGAMPCLALFPTSLHFLRVRASGTGRETKLLLEALARSDCLPALKAIPIIVRDAPTASEQHLPYEETIFAARTVALKSLRKRGLRIMPNRSERGPKQIWKESLVAYRAAVDAASPPLHVQQAIAGAWANTQPGVEQWQAAQDNDIPLWMPIVDWPVWPAQDFAPDLAIIPINAQDQDHDQDLEGQE